jgi:hypothetical protein
VKFKRPKKMTLCHLNIVGLSIALIITGANCRHTQSKFGFPDNMFEESEWLKNGSPSFNNIASPNAMEMPKFTQPIGWNVDFFQSPNQQNNVPKKSYSTAQNWGSFPPLPSPFLNPFDSPAPQHAPQKHSPLMNHPVSPSSGNQMSIGAFSGGQHHNGPQLENYPQQNHWPFENRINPSDGHRCAQGSQPCHTPYKTQQNTQQFVNPPAYFPLENPFRNRLAAAASRRPCPAGSKPCQPHQTKPTTRPGSVSDGRRCPPGSKPCRKRCKSLNCSHSKPTFNTGYQSQQHPKANHSHAAAGTVSNKIVQASASDSIFGTNDVNLHHHHFFTYIRKNGREEDIPATIESNANRVQTRPVVSGYARSDSPVETMSNTASPRLHLVKQNSEIENRPSTEKTEVEFHPDAITTVSSIATDDVEIFPPAIIEEIGSQDMQPTFEDMKSEALVHDHQENVELREPERMEERGKCDYKLIGIQFLMILIFN